MPKIKHGLAQADAVRDVAEQRRSDHPAERNHRVSRDRFRRRDARDLMQERNAPDLSPIVVGMNSRPPIMPQR